jgi:hypothetical protein
MSNEVTPEASNDIVTDLESKLEEFEVEPSLHGVGLAGIRNVQNREDKLEAFVVYTRLEKELKELKAGLMLEANASFNAHYEAEDGSVEILGHKVVRVSPKTVYTYPADVVQQEKDYKAAKKAAEISGTAVGTPAAQDPSASQLFRVM